MIPKFALRCWLPLAFRTVQQAAAQDSTLGGALFGGAAGAILGGAIGGGRGRRRRHRRAGTGAAIGAQGEPRPGGYRWYRAAATRAARRLAGSFTALLRVQAQYAPPRERYYDDTPRCMRSPTYNPRTGTFIGRDDYERATRKNQV